MEGAAIEPMAARSRAFMCAVTPNGHEGFASDILGRAVSRMYVYRTAPVASMGYDIACRSSIISSDKNDHSRPAWQDRIIPAFSISSILDFSRSHRRCTTASVLASPQYHLQILECTS